MRKLTVTLLLVCCLTMTISGIAFASPDNTPAITQTEKKHKSFGVKNGTLLSIINKLFITSPQ
ncbi:MAG: hypothetical protein H6Q68_1119 [Firmicutes bacterium]|nr:hypothetical protein [Bacillota bacterium]